MTSFQWPIARKMLPKRMYAAEATGFVTLAVLVSIREV